MITHVGNTHRYKSNIHIEYYYTTIRGKLWEENDYLFSTSLPANTDHPAQEEVLNLYTLQVMRPF